MRHNVGRCLDNQTDQKARRRSMGDVPVRTDKERGSHIL